MIAPPLHQVLHALSRHFTGELDQRWQAWRERYLPELLVLLKEMRREATQKSRMHTATLTKLIDSLLPENRRTQPLSRKALWVLASTPGVTSVLNGARTPAYVEDSTTILHWEPLSDVMPVYRAMMPG